MLAFRAVRAMVPTSQRGWRTLSTATRGVTRKGMLKPLRTFSQRALREPG